MPTFVFVDGSFRGKIGGYGIFGRNRRIAQRCPPVGRVTRMNNNVMELLACVEGLAVTRKNGDGVIMFTDSAYVLDGIAEPHFWTRRPHLHDSQLFAELLQNIREFDASLVHVAAHRPEPSGGFERFVWHGNREANALARSATAADLLLPAVHAEDDGLWYADMAELESYNAKRGRRFSRSKDK